YFAGLETKTDIGHLLEFGDDVGDLCVFEFNRYLFRQFFPSLGYFGAVVCGGACRNGKVKGKQGADQHKTAHGVDLQKHRTPRQLRLIVPRSSSAENEKSFLAKGLE